MNGTRLQTGRSAGCRWAACLMLACSAGIPACGSLGLGLAVERPEPQEVTGLGGVVRREAAESPAPPKIAVPAATEKTDVPPEALAAMGKPYQLNRDNIIHLVYHMSPDVMAERESMVAAQYALDEFRANLSRLEPFVSTGGTYSDFPERRGAHGMTGEITGGLEKETFEGAIIRLEGGASGSRFTFDEFEDRDDAKETGEGGLIRARLEVPFIGSRRRQNRIISQAFQESNNRKAKLTYVTRFRTYTINALQYYQGALLYLGYSEAYEEQTAELEKLLEHKELTDQQRRRIESTLTNTNTYRDQYKASYRASVIRLLTSIGIEQDDEYEIERPEYQPSAYIEQAATQEGHARMLADAYANNPQFQVLEDAIADTELQRRYAIEGKLDITAYVQGTHFPIGSASYDNRLGGWEVGTGVTVRLNDARVLTATRLKAEAEIRQFKAEIESQQQATKLQISLQTDTLQSYHDLRSEIVELTEKKRAEYEERKSEFFGKNEAGYQIDDVIYPLGEVTSARTRLASNNYYCALAEDALLGATGEIYQIVGMKVETDEKAEPKGLFGIFSP